ncbi:hypothetical protein LPB140_00260 [Sphingorhabdus lutea]|uniref:DUF6869 domain-containing protein n=1 Tax=Sphingorhabdus lutea TaxID=1913578 RepID=A0A1L3J8U4_9SPHN|nr:hypothetical protein [Sphingorhabdus lutea]APG61534.1 hypothetical protein LPB140_00260 [Sphingorhabdus lutea]
MQNQDIQKLARGWIEEYSSPNKDLPQDDKCLDHWNALEDMISAMNPESWDVIVSIIKASDDEYIIANVAAGPLENFIAKLGHKSLNKIENEALNSPRFAYALRGVWQNLTPDDVWERITMIVKKTGG